MVRKHLSDKKSKDNQIELSYKRNKKENEKNKNKNKNGKKK